MNVIIDRALVISRDELEEYGIGGQCIHKSIRGLQFMGLKPYITVPKGHFAKVEVLYWPAEFDINQLNVSSLIMFYLACKYGSSYPDQLGLLLCSVDGRKTVYAVYL
jgi:hypothetical protein